MHGHIADADPAKQLRTLILVELALGVTQRGSTVIPSGTVVYLL
jgi:hypothetical protein